MSNGDFLRNCLTGMFLAEPPAQGVGNGTRATLCVCHALADSAGRQESFATSLSAYLGTCEWGPDDTQLVAVRSLPIGLYHDELPPTIEWARDAAMLSTDDPVVIVSAAAVALLGFLAKKEIPVGLWGHELCATLAGLGLPPLAKLDSDTALLPGSQKPKVDDVFLDSIMRASSAAGRAQPHSWNGGVHDAVGAALFGCMCSPGNFKLAVSLATDSSGPSAACIAGGLMAIRNGPPSSSVPPSIQELLFDASAGF